MRLRGFFIILFRMNRTIFLIDGFNLYFSVRQASRDLGGKTTKWLDVQSLCSSLLHIVGNDAQLENVYYFSAMVSHLQRNNPGIVSRQRAYLRCLENSGVNTVMGRFKKKNIRCHSCQTLNLHHEEKETDVAIALKLMEIFVRDECDTAVIVTGDTDLAPAFRTAQSLFPLKKVMFAFPYKRKNQELAKLTSTFEIGRDTYLKHQFPDQVTLQNKKVITKPAKW